MLFVRTLLFVRTECFFEDKAFEKFGGLFSGGVLKTKPLNRYVVLSSERLAEDKSDGKPIRFVLSVPG